MARPNSLTLLSLEDRLAPALNILFDYSRDVSGFFADPGRRQQLESTAAGVVAPIVTSLPAITPTAGNTWTARFFDPATGGQFEVPNLAVPADSIVVYVGGRDLIAAEAGEGGFGGYRASGDAGFLSTIQTRLGVGAPSVWGGSIAFDADQNWYFGADARGLQPGQVDFTTVVTHELGHLLGFGTAATYNSLISNRNFLGATAQSVYGGPVPVSADLAHLAPGTTYGGQPVSLQPYLIANTRYGLSLLDYAVLKDVGWAVNLPFGPTSPVTPPTVPPEIPPVTVVPPATPPVAGAEPKTIELHPNGCTCGQCGALSIGGGTLTLFNLSGTGGTPAAGDALTPFPGFTGSVRSTTADVTGDGIADVVAGVGPGGGSGVRVYNGATGATVFQVSAFEPGYTGGVFVAAADLNGDGRAELVITPDRGGGGRVVVLDSAGRSLTSFYGIEDPKFRGGARIAAADVNGDGAADIVVGAGIGGGPRVAVFDGRSLLAGAPRKLMNDFFAFDGADVTSLANGVNLSAGDLNNDGRAEIVFGGGPGGSPRILVLSGAALMVSPAAAKAAPLANFFAFGSGDRGGARPAVKDVDADGQMDLIVGSGSAAAVMVYAAGDPAAGRWFTPFGAVVAADGVYVG